MKEAPITENFTSTNIRRLKESKSVFFKYSQFINFPIYPCIKSGLSHRTRSLITMFDIIILSFPFLFHTAFSLEL